MKRGRLNQREGRTLTTTTERRGCERLTLERPITLGVGSVGKNAYFDAVTVDVSELGTQVRGYFLLRPGEPIDLMPQGANRPISSRVVWFRSSPDFLGQAGLEFLEPTQLFALGKPNR